MESGFALNVLFTFSELSLFRNALLQCEIHILATDLIIRSKDVLLLLPYLSNRPQVSMVYKLINHAGCW